MKEILILSTLFFSLSINAQIHTTTADTSGIKFIEPPDSTGFGTPDGKLVNKQIGAIGGTIISDDGRVALIFPAGALTENTTISIQPITNPAPNGAGKAYDFEPSGIQFKKPVQIIFHYTDEEAETCPADLMGFAIQDQKGKWSFFDYDDWDSTAKILKGFIHHFSDFTDYDNLVIRPGGSGSVMPNESISVMGYDRSGVVESGEYEGEYEFANLNSKNRMGWFVNDVPKGNEFEGTMDNRIHTIAGKTYVFGIYDAPRYLPVKNPVRIKLAVYCYSKKLKKKAWRSFSCEILVYDSYRVSVISEFTARIGMASKLVDSASFIVSIFPFKSYIDDIKNYEPIVIREGRNGPFKEKIFTDQAQGSIHLTEVIKNFSLSKDNPPEVYFEFSSFLILRCVVQYSARGIKGPEESVYAKSIPGEINFIANGQEQHISEQNGEGGEYHVIVKPHRRK